MTKALTGYDVVYATMYHTKYVLRKLFFKSQLGYMPTYKQCYYVGP